MPIPRSYARRCSTQPRTKPASMAFASTYSAPQHAAGRGGGEALSRHVVSSRAALLYVAAIVIGSGIATLQRGSWTLTTTLGPRFEQLWGDGSLAVLTLFGGGIVVGFGTRMAGGCTSGHGLSGCSRFQLGSLDLDGDLHGGGGRNDVPPAGTGLMRGT